MVTKLRPHQCLCLFGVTAYFTSHKRKVSSNCQTLQDGDNMLQHAVDIKQH